MYEGGHFEAGFIALILPLGVGGANAVARDGRNSITDPDCPFARNKIRSNGETIYARPIVVRLRSRAAIIRNRLDVNGKADILLLLILLRVMLCD